MELRQEVFLMQPKRVRGPRSAGCRQWHSAWRPGTPSDLVMDNFPAIEEVDDLDLITDEELEETYLERLVGLKEMFPSPVRTGSSHLIGATKTSSLWFYHFVREAIWITTTSAIILALPLAIEVTQIQAQDDLKKVRNEKLFEANAAMSAAVITPPMEEPVRNELAELELDNGEDDKTPGLDAPAAKKNKKKKKKKKPAGDTQEEGISEEPAKPAEGDEVEAGDQVEDGAGGDAPAKKKKKKKKKKGGAGGGGGGNRPQQTDPPTIAIGDLYPDGEFPLGEICQYTDDNLWRTSSQEMKMKDFAFEEALKEARQAAEAHRQKHSIHKPPEMPLIILYSPEMFPSPVRTGSSHLIGATKTSSLWFYHFVREAIWITTTSAIILALPLAIEVTQIQAQDDLKKVRNEKLFEANAAMSAAVITPPMEEPVRNELAELELDNGEDDKTPGLDAPAAKKNKKKKKKKKPAGDTQEEGISEEPAKPAEGDEVEAGDQVEDGAGGDAPAKKKKKKKKKKGGAGGGGGGNRPQQTDPPTIAIGDLYPDGEFPLGEICQYTDDNLWRTSSQEMKMKDFAFEEALKEARQAAEAHRQRTVRGG
eukprot:sb/3463258/